MSIFKKQKIELSEQQQEAVDFVTDFANNQHDILIITGEAGSGKTETIKQIFSTSSKFENKYFNCSLRSLKIIVCFFFSKRDFAS